MFGLNDIRNTFVTIERLTNEIEVKGSDNLSKMLMIINACEECVKGIDEAVKEMADRQAKESELSPPQEGD